MLAKSFKIVLELCIMRGSIGMCRRIISTGQSPKMKQLRLLHSKVIERIFDPATVARGKDYFAREKVLSVEINDETIYGSVVGRNNKTYQTRVDVGLILTVMLTLMVSATVLLVIIANMF